MQSNLNQPPFLSAVRFWLHSVRVHVHDMRNPGLVCGPMKFLLIKPC